MNLSEKTKLIAESETLRLNTKANQLASEGKKIYNLTAGQLPYRPPKDFVENIRGELDFLKSFQYSPVPGENLLREKLLNYFETSRSLNLEDVDTNFSVVVGNGGKHVLSNIFACLLNPGDEVILITPYWVSYPEMIKLNDGVVKMLETSIFDAFTPSLEELRKLFSKKTKAIVINSPNNPSGSHYSEEWMREFAELMLEYPEVTIISDEIYYELYYFDPAPTYFYQFKPELLERTIIVDGISKNLASTGLRIGYGIGPSDFMNGVSRYQGHTTSGACTLVQKALEKYDFDAIKEFLVPVKNHLRENSMIVREAFREVKLDKCWYQTLSAFYYIVDFSQCPILERFRKNKDDEGDYSAQICEEILEKFGVAMVPGSAFGVKNSARISLVLPKEAFSEAMAKIAEALVN